MPKMKAVEVPKPGADFEIVEKEIPEPLAPVDGILWRPFESLEVVREIRFCIP